VHNQLSGFGAVKIRRRSDAGNLSDQHTTGAYIRGMRADFGWLYWVEDFGSTKQVKLAMYWF